MIVKLILQTIETVSIKVAQTTWGHLFGTGGQTFLLSTSHIPPRSSDLLRARLSVNNQQTDHKNVV